MRRIGMMIRMTRPSWNLPLVMATSTASVETGCSGCGTEQSKYEYLSSYGTNLSANYVLPD
jgi:hypothetical protein